MKLLLKSATIIDKKSPFHLSKQDILIEDGIIRQIQPTLSVPADKVIKNLYVSQGWVDSSVSFGEPGHEERETLGNGMNVAARSGFTQIMLNPNSQPISDTKSAITFFKNNTQNAINELFPIGALTLQSQGEYLAELYDMATAGAVAFGDYKKTIYNANLLKIALQYTQNFGGIVISFANDKTIAGKGVVNEHFTSTKLGLKGIPVLAEELVIARDLSILEYTGGKLHIPTISSAGSVELIAKAKAKGLDVTCSVAIHNLHLTDAALEDFDTNYKTLPPLRDEIHVKALRNALNSGIIDFVTSDHCPMNIEEKQVEFDLAAYGTIGLETAFGILTQYTSIEKVIELFTNAKIRFSLPCHTINIDEIANLTLFSIDETHVFEKKNILSTSKNSAFIGEKLKGKVLGIVVKDKFLLN